MGKIKILDEIIAGRIAAGEVVERPSSIIKELVENSIDAGATSVSIAIQDGGIRSIRVTDNGNGISKEDMPLTVIKHATSKLAKLSDLESIYTMGFRGEALFSISAVSMMKISSRIKNAEAGSELIANGGKVLSISDAGVPEGTTVSVENLFYNTPARLKFLKKPSVEAANITDLVSKFILSHPEISIRYSSNGSVIYHSAGNGDLKDCISLLYGRETALRIIPLSGQFGAIKISGFIGQPDLTFKNKKHGTIFVNNRYIKSDIVESAILKGYGERLLKGTHPFYCIKIDMPVEDVDVNVHPNKLFVHFKDDHAVEYIVYNAVYQAISTRETTSYVDLEPVKRSNRPLENEENKNEIDNGVESSQEKQSVYINSNLTDFNPQKDQGASVFIPEIDNVKDDNAIEKSKNEISFLQAKSEFDSMRSEQISDKPISARQFSCSSYEPSKSEVTELFSKLVSNDESKEEKQAKKEIPIFSESAFSYKIVGTLFSTYILVECGDTVYIIDQHALHERLLYDELTKKTKNPAILHLLVSEVVTLSHSESVVLQDNLDVLRQMGYEIEPFGPMTFKIDAVPKLCGSLDIRGMIGEIAAELSFGANANIDIQRDKIARAACKAAIKGGDALTDEQIKAFLKEADATGAIPHCPHGRPIFTAITKVQLEKSFKRRV